MRKKWIAMALCMLALGGCFAAAEEPAAETVRMTEAFSFVYTRLPEGYTMETVEDETTEFRARITTEEEGRPRMELLVRAYNPEWEGVRGWGEAPAEYVAEVKESFYQETGKLEGEILFEDAETRLGTPVLIARAADGSLVAVYTNYLSHEIEIDLFQVPGGAPVAEEDLRGVIDFLGEVEFALQEE